MEGFEGLEGAAGAGAGGGGRARLVLPLLLLQFLLGLGLLLDLIQSVLGATASKLASLESATIVATPVVVET